MSETHHDPNFHAYFTVQLSSLLLNANDQEVDR